MFNNSQYASAIESGEYTAVVLSDDPVSPVTARDRRWPPDTRSQYVRYTDAEGEWVVEVHRYVKPDGTLAASGRPDPKRLRLGDKIYLFDPRL